MAMTRTFTSDFTSKPITGDSARVSVTLGDDVWVADAASNEDIVKLIKSHGFKQAKRGRKAGSSNNSASNGAPNNSSVGSSSQGAVAGKVNR
jgi:hypothetical protein